MWESSPAALARKAAARLVEILRLDMGRDPQSARNAALQELGVLRDQMRIWSCGEPVLSMQPDFAEIRAEAKMLANLLMDGKSFNMETAVEAAESLSSKVNAWAKSTRADGGAW